MTQTLLRRILLGAGALLAASGALWWWHGERVFARMRPTTCRLVVKSVESRLLVRGSSRRIGSRSRLRYRDEARMVFAHVVEGRKYTFREDFNADQMPLADYEEGKAYPCRYDPQDPGRATITTTFDREAVKTVLMVAAFLIVLGIMMPQLWRQAAAGVAQMRERVW